MLPLPPPQTPRMISGISGISGSGPGTVFKDKLKDAVDGCTLENNNSLDDKSKPRDADVIVKEALSQVGTEHQYDLLDYNCEHFATKLRYGQGESRQVINAVLAAGAATGAVGLGLVALAGAISAGGSKEKKNTQ